LELFAQPDFKKLLSDTLKKVAEDAQASVLGEGMWEEEPVSPEVFFREWCKPEPYPIQREVVDKMLVRFGKDGKWKWDTKYREGYLLWGMGSGKDFTAARIMVYTVYWLLCQRCPQKYFKMEDPKDAIDLVNISFNEDQAQFVYFKMLKKTLASTVNPKTGKNWFEEKGMKIKETSKLQMIEFPKYVTAYSLNSKEYQMEGKNVLMAVFDEMGAFKVARADEIFKNLKGNMRSRFPEHHKLLCISYKRDDYDYMMVKWEQNKCRSDVFRSGPYATWDVNKRVTREQFQEAYDTNPEDAEKRYECKGSTIKSGYFKYKEKITEHINHERISPIMGEGGTQQFCQREPATVKFYDWFVGDPSKEYHIHIDLAKGLDTEKDFADCGGFAMGHLESTENSSQPNVVVDVMMQIKAKEKGKEIQFEDIRKLIYRLKDELKFNITKVTLDGYQSTDFMQQLANRGIRTELLSVDLTSSPYDTLKGLMYTGRLDYYAYNVFIRELEELKQVKGKIDHPEISRRRAWEEQGDERGSKDVSDAVAGICASLIAKPKGPAVGFIPLTGGDEFMPENFNPADYKEKTKYDENQREYGSNYEIDDDEDD